LQRTIKFGLYGLVLAGVLAGTAAWATAGTSVDLRIDGHDQRVRTTASDVRGVLAEAKISVGEHDIVAPDLASQIQSGSQIVVRRGHLLELSVNGKTKQVWVNADSVDQALSQLGYDSTNLVSVSRSTRLDAGATRVSIDSPKRVTFKVDHKSYTVLSAGPSVYQAIADANIYLGPADRLSRTGPITNNEVVTIKRVTYGQSVAIVTVPFPVLREQDAASYVGTDTVLTPGKDGTSRVTYQLIYVDGRFAGRVASQTVVLAPPTSEVKKVGSKAAPAFVASVPAGSAQKIAAGMVVARGWGNDQFGCLVSLWNKESGWRTDAANPSGAYGIPQALPGSKMASVAADWQTNPATQITWGLNYISGTYGTPCAAWAHSQADNWY
jgi:uncharacterized protein YabE (DUF348 family)